MDLRVQRMVLGRRLAGRRRTDLSQWSPYYPFGSDSIMRCTRLATSVTGSSTSLRHGSILHTRTKKSCDPETRAGPAKRPNAAAWCGIMLLEFCMSTALNGVNGGVKGVEVHDGR